jgi:hypothetical protein
MRLCIICEDKDIEAARENCKNIFTGKKPDNLNLPSFIDKDSLPKTHLSIPLSESGEGLATHWFCFLSCDDSTHQRIFNNKLYSHVEESSPKEFLEKWNLKIIK